MTTTPTTTEYTPRRSIRAKGVARHTPPLRSTAERGASSAQLSLPFELRADVEIELGRPGPGLRDAGRRWLALNLAPRTSALLAWLWSRPPGWRFAVTDLAAELGWSIRSVWEHAKAAELAKLLTRPGGRWELVAPPDATTTPPRRLTGLPRHTLAVDASNAYGLTDHGLTRWAARELSGRAWRVWLWLISHAAGWRTEREQIAAALGVKLRTVQRAFAELRELGALTTDYEREIWTLHVPPAAASSLTSPGPVRTPEARPRTRVPGVSTGGDSSRTYKQGRARTRAGTSLERSKSKSRHDYLPNRSVDGWPSASVGRSSSWAPDPGSRQPLAADVSADPDAVVTVWRYLVGGDDYGSPAVWPRDRTAEIRNVGRAALDSLTAGRTAEARALRAWVTAQLHTSDAWRRRIEWVCQYWTPAELLEAMQLTGIYADHGWRYFRTLLTAMATGAFRRPGDPPADPWQTTADRARVVPESDPSPDRGRAQAPTPQQAAASRSWDQRPTTPRTTP